MVKDSDLKLLKKAQNGDKKSFELLFEKYYKKALEVSYRITGNLSESEDITMESFWDIYALEIRKDLNFSAYFMKVVVNNSINDIKKNKRFVSEFSEDLYVQQNSDPDEIILKKDETENVKKLLDKLPINQKTAFILVKYEGYSYKETASIMKLTEKSVEALLWRARKKLSEMIVDKKEK
ncbi:MAG: RNA polymerase sigma factor [Armatimonadetes bacterium]|nr:RNA polymerase sigma factor [Candidatus Hippobium faecium]